MEEWLKAKGFQEKQGKWHRLGKRDLQVFIGEDGDWSAYFLEPGISFTDSDMLFSSLPEDQAKESIERLLSL